MKPIAIIFSDLHINIWSKFNEGNRRTLNHFKVLSCIKDICNKHKIPALFCGDLLHKPENLDQDLAKELIPQFKDIFEKGIYIPDLYMISGNHDIKNISRVGTKPFSWVSMLSNLYAKIRCIDYDTIWLQGNIYVHGVPYVDHNIGLSEYLKNLKLTEGTKNILLLHTDYPGAKDTDGREVDSVENLNINILNKFDLVLCGHIHKPQRLSKKVYMIGAPLQQRRTDSNCKLGYWELYEDLSLKFIEFKDFPKFIDVEKEEDKKEDGNYYTVLPKKTRVEVNNNHKITKQLSKKSLAKQYMKERGIKDKDKKNLLINLLNKAESC